MLKEKKLKNSTILLIGIILIIIGLFLGFYEYFKQEKLKIFSEMSIRLYKSEIPNNIESDEELKIIDNEITGVVENPNEDNSNVPSDNQHNYIGILEIPKIGLKRGFLNVNSKYNSINYNVTVISGSTLPDQKNSNLILAAHSGSCSVCFFDKLFNLSIGDVTYIYYNDVKYSYKLVNIYEVEKTGTVAIYRDYTKNSLTLITCTKNSKTKQTVYILELSSKENY